VIKSNLFTRKVQNLPRQKKKYDVLFLSSPNSTCRTFSRQQEKIWG